ncbi:MAG: alpha/beta fold hydrolase, partial [Myxococcota bacterium]
AFAIGAALGERVVIVGVSTGATLATIAAFDAGGAQGSAVTSKAPRPDAFVFLSPNYGLKSASSQLILWPWASNWLPFVAGSERAWEPSSEDHGRYWTTRYPVQALFPMMASVASAASGPVESISVPTLVFLSDKDEVVSTEATRGVLKRWGGPQEIRLVDGAGDDHVIAGRILSPTRTSTLARTTAAWLETVR